MEEVAEDFPVVFGGGGALILGGKHNSSQMCFRIV